MLHPIRSQGVSDVTDAAPTTRHPHDASDAPDAPSPAGLVLLSLSSMPEAGSPQAAFDPAIALVKAATAEDSSVDEVVLLRLLVLRRAHPDAVVRTRLERVDGDQIVVRASIALATGASATAFATAEGGMAAIESAERRAIGRAMDVLGEAVLLDTTRTNDEPLTPRAEPDIADHGQTEGTPEAMVWDDDDPDAFLPGRDGDEPAPYAGREAPREIPPSRFSPPPSRTRAGAAPERQTVRDEPTPTTTTAPPPAVVDAVRRANLRRHAAGQPSRGPGNEPYETDAPADIDATTATPAPTSPVNTADDPPLEHYSWTAFWRVARPLGLDKMKVEKLIGEPITSLTPLQVREKLKAAGVDI